MPPTSVHPSGPLSAGAAAVRGEIARLYLITDRALFPEGAFLPAVERALKGGARLLQLREKDLDDAELFRLARSLRELTRGYGARLFINSRPDVARACGADGVHLPDRADLTVRDVKKHFPGLAVGVSTHSLARALRAEKAGADFVTFGPLFDTPSKRAWGAPLGLDALREATGCLRLPVYALGGVKSRNLSAVLEAGAHGAALITGIWRAHDIERETREYIRILEEAHHES